MLVSISIGSKSRAVINTLKVSADNFDFSTYSSMAELIKSAKLRHLSFDRIVFSSEILNSRNPEEDLEALHDFITNYSSQTELVFIIKGSSDSENNLDKVFSSMFNSPMYTPVIMKKASAQTLLEIVRDDITELKTRYYVLQEKEDRVITSASMESNQPKEEVKEAPEQPKQEKKKGLFGRVFGTNAKKEALLKEIASASKEGSQTAGNTGENATNESLESADKSGSSVTGDIGEAVGNTYGSKIEKKNIFEENDLGRVSDGVENLNSGFSDPMSEDEMLSIGEFGEKHSDTGFLDTDDEEELRRYAESREASEPVVEKEVEKEAVATEEDPDFYGFDLNFDMEDVEEVSENTGEQEEVYEEVDKIVEEVREERPVQHMEEPVKRTEPVRRTVPEEKATSNIDVVVSVKGSGATQSIVDEAVRMVEEDHLKVLIVDLDLKENGVLSYIDTERFYMQGSNDGIFKMRVYEEDGVGVVSNGYGVPVSRKMLMNFISSRLVKKYDMVFIDCPVNSLSLFDYDMISMCNVLVMSGNDRSDLLATTLAITDRKNVEYKVERYIAETCMVEITGGKYRVEDVTWLNDICLFANGNWLSRIDV